MCLRDDDLQKHGMEQFDEAYACICGESEEPLTLNQLMEGLAAYGSADIQDSDIHSSFTEYVRRVGVSGALGCSPPPFMPNGVKSVHWWQQLTPFVSMLCACVAVHLPMAHTLGFPHPTEAMTSSPRKACRSSCRANCARTV